MVIQIIDLHLWTVSNEATANTQTTMTTTTANPTVNAIELLSSFVRKRAGLEFCNYGDVKAYRAEQREITKDLHDFRELLNLYLRRVENANVKLIEYFENNSGRLTLDNGKLQYITGQYFPTEYRPAANRTLANLIWKDYSNEIENGKNVYETGHEIRKALKRNLSRRVILNYFN